MGKKFKWDMFVTSFIPLWISIIVIDIWNIIEGITANWDSQKSLNENVRILLFDNLLLLATLLIVIILVVSSMMSIRKFMVMRNQGPSKPLGTIISARRANKLSSEFLLAYILPMIAFDFTNLKTIVLFVIYFAVLAVLCIRNNNVYTNIYLEFLGYKMYEGDISCKGLAKDYVYKNSLLISMIDLTQEIENDLPYWDFENYIYIILNNKEGRN